MSVKHTLKAGTADSAAKRKKPTLCRKQMEAGVQRCSHPHSGSGWLASLQAEVHKAQKPRASKPRSLW